MSWHREWQAGQQAERCYRGWHSVCSVRCTITDHAWCDSGAVMAWGVFLPLSCNCAKFFLSRDNCMFWSYKAQTVPRKRLNRFNVLFSELFPSSLPNGQAMTHLKSKTYNFPFLSSSPLSLPLFYQVETMSCYGILPLHIVKICHSNYINKMLIDR